MWFLYESDLHDTKLAMSAEVNTLAVKTNDQLLFRRRV